MKNVTTNAREMQQPLNSSIFGVRDEELRSAVEAVLSEVLHSQHGTSNLNTQNEPPSSSSHCWDDRIASASHSLSSLDKFPGEDVLLGARTDGRMSVARRFFCLFVLFDLLLTSLTWLICIMLIGSKDILGTLKFEIVYYKISTSLFDIVMAAACRFTILLLFYGVLYLYTRFFVAVTTAGTCIFLIFKVFYYNWTVASQPVFQVCLILISFVIAWTEAWFLDFRVIPQELHAQQYLQSAVRHSDSLNALLFESPMRHSVLRNFLQRAQRMEDSAESVRNFYSPLESPDQSDEETDDHARTGISVSELKRKAKENLEIAWKLLNSCDWRIEKESQSGDIIYSKQIPHVGKVFKLKTVINMSPKKLLQELYYCVENITVWNNTIIESKRIQIIDECTDVTYQVSAPGGNGIIASRDFVNLRHWSMKDNCYVVAGKSIVHPTVPPTGTHTRGENGACCWVMRPLSEDVDSCIFEFLLNTNLKGWIPQYVLDGAFTGVLMEYSQLLKKYTQLLKEKNIS